MKRSAGSLLVAFGMLCSMHVGSAVAAPVVGVVGSNVLVRPAAAPVGASRLELVAAANEFESAQVVVRAHEAAISDLDVQVSGALMGPEGARIPASAISVYRVGYYDVSGHPSDGDLGGAMGAFPDSLIPRVDTVWGEARTAFPIDVPQGQNRVAWIDVLVPPGTPTGRYEGAFVDVRAGDVLLQQIPVQLDVANLDLPSTTTLDGGFDINPNRLCLAHACGSFPGGSTALAAAYARVALDNRLTLAKPPTSTPSGPQDPAYRTWTRPLLVGTAPTRLPSARLRTVTIYQWARESADEWRRIAEADGLLDRVRFHCDEIGTSTTAWARCRDDWNRANELWGDAASGAEASDLPLQITTSIDDVQWARANGFSEFVDRIAVLIPVINRLHPKSQPAFPGRRAEFAAWDDTETPGGAPRALWSYTSCMSMGCSSSAGDQHPLWSGWPSYGIDQPAAEARAMGWVSYTYDLAGEYYYETARDLPTAWSSLWSHDGGNHGDGTLFYPGTVDRVGGTRDTVIESIRLKRIRDGREDYEWLQAAQEQAGRASVLAIARSAFATAFDTDVEQARIDQARLLLADLLAGRSRPPVTEPPSDPPPGDPAPDDPPVDDPPNRTPNGKVTCAGQVATLVGTPRRDVLRGTPKVDVIHGLGGNDVIHGLGRNDIICGGPGDDTIVTGRDSAADRVYCGAGRDAVTHDRRDQLARDCERKTSGP